MKYLKIRKMEQPFYFTYEKVCEIMREYLPKIEYFASFINDNLRNIHCGSAGCISCSFQTDPNGYLDCSFVTPTVVYNPTYEHHLREDEAEGLVKGLNITREICSGHTDYDCSKCWLRNGPKSMYLCGCKRWK